MKMSGRGEICIVVTLGNVAFIAARLNFFEIDFHFYILATICQKQTRKNIISWNSLS